MLNFIKKYWVLILGVLISTIINIPHLCPSYYLDGYCSLCEGFSNYALTFVKAGRYITAAVYYIIDLLKVNPAIFSIISIILSNIILSIGMQIIYNDVLSLTNNDINNKLITFIGSFLICFNPFNIELYLFEESFVICLGILTTILAGSVYFNYKRFSFIKTLFLLLIAASCYQGTLALFIPYVFLLTCIKNKNQNIFNNIKDNYKFYIKGLICYGMSLVLAFVLLKIVLLIFNLNSLKMGELNVLFNIKTILFLLKDMLSNLFNIVNINWFYTFLVVMLFIYISYILLNFKKDYSKLIYVILIILLCLITAFIPNLAMNSLGNYTAARMTTSIGSINGFIFLLSLIFMEKNTIYKYIQIIICLIGVSIVIFYAITYFNSAKDNLNRYQNDIKYISNINKIINKYETNTNKITKIKFAINSLTDHYYKEPHNTINIRVNDVDWGLDCILSYNNPTIEITRISEQEISSLNLEEGKNFKYMFDENTMYLLIW